MPAAPCRAIFQARTSVYHRPLYSRLSILTEAVIFSPMLSRFSSTFSPHKERHTFLGYWPGVSMMNSCFFQTPFFPCPVCRGNKATTVPLISIAIQSMFKQVKVKVIPGYNAPILISSTMAGSSSVEISPRLVVSPSATLRKILRMILPDRVFGNPLTN